MTPDPVKARRIDLEFLLSKTRTILQNIDPDTDQIDFAKNSDKEAATIKIGNHTLRITLETHNGI